MYRPASRLKDIAPFHVMEILARAKVLEASGRDIIHMEVGEPDFPTPEPIVRAAQAAIADGKVHYTPALGLPALREAISAHYQRRYGITVPAERIMVTTGASGALTLALACLVEPGRRWLLPDPGYPCNRHFVRSFEGIPISLPVDQVTNFQPTTSHLEQLWNTQTDGLIVASPANPTGTMLTAPQLSQLGAFVAHKQGHFIVDEIYHGLSYDGDAPTALAAEGEPWVVQSFSKYFQMTGWRLGWLVAPEAYLRDVEKLAQNLFISPPTPAQYAALAAFLPETMEILEARRAEFGKRRNFLAPALEALGFRVTARPEGAFYLYCDSSALAPDSFSLALRMLEAVGVAVTPGLDFGSHHPERHIRFAYTAPIERLQEAILRLKTFFG